MAARVRNLLSAHPLVGTWVDCAEDGSSVEYTVRATSSGFTVTGIDTDDGEAFVITHVSWAGVVLRFTSVMPSTKHLVEHEMTVTDDGTATHRSTIVERWKKHGV